MLGTTNYRIEGGTGLLETLMISMKTMQDTRQDPRGTHRAADRQSRSPRKRRVSTGNLMADLRALVESLRIPHHSCEDCWYSCPKSPDGSCNDNYADDECNCLADSHNAKVEATLRLIDGQEAP